MSIKTHYHGSRWRIINGLILLLVYPVLAHDTNTTHPRLTISAGELIENSDADTGAYYDLYKTSTDEDKLNVDSEPFPYLWGQDPRLNEEKKELDEKTDYEKFRHKLKNVVDGVVMEDTPYNRVFSHFQHAYTEQSMELDWWRAFLDGLAKWLGDTRKSEDMAKIFFYDSVEMMGYLEDLSSEDGTSQQPSKPLAFWLFGHALHHVEDMSSVAHVHSDIHLNRLPSLLGERDDYEAHYIPNKIYDNEAPWLEFSENIAIQPISDFKDIWGSASATFPSTPGASLLDSNLARSTYNVATFQANLDVYRLPEEAYERDWRIDQEATREKAIKNGVFCGKGELAEMFYFGEVGPGSDWASGQPEPELCGLHMAFGRKYPHWVIRYASAHDNDEGEYYPHHFDSLDSDWWDIRVFYENGPPGFYYIEQVMQGVKWDDGTRLLRPMRLRGDISRNYSESENPLGVTCTDNNSVERRCKKGVAIVDRWANVLAPRSIGFIAGFSQYWYDIANTPPYLAEVKAEQEDDGWVVKYGKQWKAPKVKKMGKMIVKLQYENGSGKNDASYANTADFVNERTSYLTVPHVQFFNLKKKIKLTLRFNEPVKAPNSTESGFRIGFKNGSINYLDNSKLKFSIFEEHDKCNQKVAEHANCWTVEIGEEILSTLSLDGRVNLVVEANDLNKHPDSGSALDADPRTPAHRNVIELGETDYQVSWHNENTQPDVEKFKTHDGLPLAAGAFAYDTGPDETHVLLFDSTPPEVIKLEAIRGDYERDGE